MKNLLSIIVMTLMGMSLMAKPVDPTVAVRVAQNFAATQVKMADNTAKIVYTHPMPESGQPAMYVVNVGPSAFVIVAADDIARPVLGYSMARPWPVLTGERRSENGEPNATEGSERASLENGEPNATEGSERASLENGERAAAIQQPSQVSSFLDDLASQIHAAQQQDITQDRETAAEWQRLQASESNPQNSQLDLPDSVGPLLTTTWDQGQYYNALCPEDANGPDGHALTGCVVTAMAQIINYWGYPIHGRGTHSYNHDTYGTLTVNYDSATYDYAHMPSALTSTSTQAQVNAVAKLMYDCGVASNMGYGSTESGAYDVDARAGLINFFRINPNASYAEKTYFSNADWYNLLQTNLANSQPVMYSGYGDAGGHTFVCDGYNADDYFHFNFGWSGYADGWYLTSAVNPAGMNFNSSQSAIVGIVPDSTGNVILGQMAGTSTFIVDEPLEFYHLLGHNAYIGTSYSNGCNNNVLFTSADSTKQLVLDVVSFVDQNITVYDGNVSSPLTALYGGLDNDLSPVVSTNYSLSVAYQGNMYYAGFQLSISQDDGCRRVSNVGVNSDTSSIQLIWTENGNATQWQIEYGMAGFSLGTGTVMTALSNTYTITGLSRLTYYDIFIRPICDGNSLGEWVKVSVMTDAPYWQDVVVTQPNSLVFDNGCVYISCAEDFVWYFKAYSGEFKAVLVSDIDMSGYKWNPVFAFYNTIDGQGHKLSNLVIEERNNMAAMISQLGGTINDLGIVDSKIYGGSLAASFCATLIGNAFNMGTITNCYVENTYIYGEDNVGGLVAQNEGIIKNCYVNATVEGNRWVGLVSSVSTGTISNCYSNGSIFIHSNCYYAGISAIANSGIINNCYSIELPMGVVGFEGQTVITDTSTFYRNDTSWVLNTPISFDNIIIYDLLIALNNGVREMNDSTMKLWIADYENDGLPRFGNYYVVNCPNVDNVTIRNVKNGENVYVVLDWDEMGTSNQWEIKYQARDSSNSPIFLFYTNNNPDTLFDLPLGKEYFFGVRSVCDSINHSGWNTVNGVVDLPYWTDVVTVQPEGFLMDTVGNVTISSAEGLTWLSVLVNGLHDNEYHSFEGKTISIVADIDLQGYRWFPIGKDWRYDDYMFRGTFFGNNHMIENLYVNSPGECLGLFGFAGYGASFYDVIILNGSVESVCGNKNYIGGLIGYGRDINMISNCSSGVTVYGTECVGSLCGYLLDQEGEATIISNCNATGNVYGIEATAGLIGEARGVIIQNCYATGNVYMPAGAWNPCYRGGLIGNFMSNAIVRNCYSTGSVEINDASIWYGTVVGCPYSNSRTQYVYGLLNSDMFVTGPSNDVITDTSSFYNNNGVQVLVTPITIDGNTYGNLLDVLNAWVAKTNDPMLKTWSLDTSNVNGGYPVFGDNYEPSCYNPTSVSITNATIIGDTTIRTQISWEQDGTPSSWEIMYTIPTQGIDSGSIVAVNSNPCVLTNLPVGQLLDFYVRAVCDSNDLSGWSNPVRYIPDKLHWTEVVTEQPIGYNCDDNGVVYISSAEGLAWLASVKNNLNGTFESVNPSRIIITADIDISEYRWTPINYFTNCILEGNGFTITGLYCNENSSLVGLFSNLDCCTIRNLILRESIIRGLLDNGTIAGVSRFSTIINCIVNGEIYGVMATGGMVGNCVQEVDIKNSGFIGVVESRSDVTISNAYNGFIGGIFGTVNIASVENSYVASEIHNPFYSGIISGDGFGFFNNVYALSYPAALNFSYGNETNSSFFTGNDSLWALITPQYINGFLYSDLLSALNAWVDANNTAGLYRHWAADSTNVNGGFPVFAAIPCPLIDVHDTVAVCETYTWNGNMYTSSIVVTDTFSTVNGCDSTVTLHLTINQSTTGDTTAVACGSFTWWNTNYTNSTNEATHTLTNAAGCDSTVTLHLTINNPIHTATTEASCETYTWNGTAYTVSGDYTYVHADNSGCTQVDTLHLTINNPVHTATTEAACETYTWNGTAYTVSGDYSYVHTDNNGCTQVDTLHLTVNHSTTGDTAAVACDSFTWWNTNYTNSTNEVTHTLTNAAGCDSTVTLHLTINHSTTGVDVQTACDSYTWIDGNTYTESNFNSQFSILNSLGCDSTVTLNLTINHSVTFYDTLTIGSNELPYDYYGNSINGQGNFTFEGTTSEGCDSTTHLFVIVNQVGIGDVQTADGITLFPNPTRGTVTVSGNGLERVEVMDVVGRTMLVVECQRDSERIDLSDLPQGTYVVRIIAENGIAVRRVVKR